jgi:anion-transporting  ArsA/GET3 family ATPase
VKSVAKLLDFRLLLVTGKGGVGKTTFATAAALSLARHGKRVLLGEVGSDDEESSPLFRMWDREDGVIEPENIAPHLDAVVVQPSSGHHAFLRDALPMKMLADAAMKSNAIRRFLAAAPTFPEMGVLYRILELLRLKGKGGHDLYDTIVLDLPATGHALALAQIPASILKVISKGPIADAVREGLAVLTNRKETGGFIATLPEMLPVSEALELASGVEAHDIPLSAVVMNRVPPDPFSERERRAVASFVEERGYETSRLLLDKLERSRVARERLASSTELPCIELPESTKKGLELADELSHELHGPGRRG